MARANHSDTVIRNRIGWREEMCENALVVQLAGAPMRYQPARLTRSFRAGDGHNRLLSNEVNQRLKVLIAERQFALWSANFRCPSANPEFRFFVAPNL